MIQSSLFAALTARLVYNKFYFNTSFKFGNYFTFSSNHAQVRTYFHTFAVLNLGAGNKTIVSPLQRLQRSVRDKLRTPTMNLGIHLLQLMPILLIQQT